MAKIAVQSVSEAGLNATYSSAAGAGDTFDNTNERRIFLHVKNGDASSHTVTVTPVQASKDVQGFGTMTKATVAVAIPAGADRFIGPFPMAAFGAEPAITYDAVTSVTLAVLEVGGA